MMTAKQVVLENEALRWRLDTSGGRPHSTALDNKLTGHTFALSEAQELALVLSAATDRVQEPLTRIEDFALSGPAQADTGQAVFPLHSPSTGLEAKLHYALDGPTRRKWAEIGNSTAEPVLLLDVELDSFGTGAPVTGGGQGMPLFLADEAFAAIEYPSGENTLSEGRVKLAHFPGHVLPPGGSYTSHTALVSVALAGQALVQFVDYIDAHSVRKRKVLSVYTPFGINNQWGPCPTLTDEETLDVLGVLGKWQKRGVRFDYFTLDTGWVDPSADLTEFRPNAYPNGPDQVIRRVETLGMKFGLWFATGWAAESCWDYPPAWRGQQRPTMAYLNGAPDKVGFPGGFCFGSQAYVDTLRKAVVRHVKKDHVRFIKFDGGNYYCDSAEHGHLPGKYSTERMFGHLIDMANAARGAAPDVFVMWYWGLRSPFWALYGDTIFESGVYLEGSGTSSTPMLYYRDSVTLAQDEAAQHAKLIPPPAKDSLGVWLADTRWGNFMGKERWREALVMDLGRGSMLFPNIWGDVYLLDDDDVRFLAWIGNLAKKNEGLFWKRRTILGDLWCNDVYGYAHFGGDHGFVFINNASFTSRKVELPLDGSIGLEAKPDAPLSLVAHFPEHQRLLHPDGKACKAGETLKLWLRPFEVLMVEVKRSAATGDLPVRKLGDKEAADLGAALAMTSSAPDPSLAIRFTEGERLKAKGFANQTRVLSATLPSLDGPQPILAMAVQLRQAEAEWKHAPFVAEIVQVRARIGDRNVQLMPVPDARQFGNTQNAGCSWVVYKARLNPAWSHKPLQVSVGAWLPQGVEAHVQAYIVKRWWQENTRPMGDGYYSNAPS